MQRLAVVSLVLLLSWQNGVVGEDLEIPDRPNILWLTVEDMSPVLGCWGDDYAHTPNLDRFAKESVSYTNAFATAPVCSPVRSCLITGLYATSLGTQRLRSSFPLPDSIRGFPTYLRDAGYFTSNNVKTDYNVANEQDLIDACWNENSSQAHWRSRAVNQPFFCVFNDMTTHQSRSMVWTFDHFRDEVQSQVSPNQVHDTETAPVPPYYPDTPIVRQTIARFYDCVSVMDQNIGALLQQLEEDGLADNTIVFFYSDHGSGLPRHKRLLHDSGMHVPLMIRFPEKFQHLAPAQPGENIDQLVSFVDFPPTVLSLVGIEPPKEMQGTPFLGRYAGPEREYVYGARDRVDEAYDLARSVRDKRFLYIRNYMPHLSYNQPSAYSDLGEIRDEITRLAETGQLAGAQLAFAGERRATEELYDVKADPLNLNNLADSEQYETVLKRMRDVQMKWCQATRDLGYLPEPIAWHKSRDSTPFEYAKNAPANGLSNIRAAADLVGKPGVTERQTALLQDSNASVRYWAVVGLRVSGIINKDLERMLGDESAAVRIEAAHALLEQGDHTQALFILRTAASSDDTSVCLRAVRSLQLLGERSRLALPQIKSARERALAADDPISLFIEFATTMHLVDLGEIEEADALQSFR